MQCHSVTKENKIGMNHLLPFNLEKCFGKEK